MSYARFLTVATIVSALCTPACATCPTETATEPTIPAYEDPCAGLVYETEPYHDAQNVSFAAGGTVRAGGTAGHLLHFESGKMLESVRVRVVPRHHEGPLPACLPTLDVRKETELGDGPAIYAADPFQARVDAGETGVATEYDAPHDLVIEPGWLTEGGTEFFVGVGGETGEGAEDFEICGTSVTLK